MAIIIGIQPLGRSGQRPEFSQSTSIALVRCILGKFLGVACHCFPPLFRCSYFSSPGASTSATTWEIPSGRSGNCGRECCPVILPKWRLSRHLGIFYMPQIYDMGPTALFPLTKEGVLRILFFPYEGRGRKFALILNLDIRWRWVAISPTDCYTVGTHSPQMPFQQTNVCIQSRSGISSQA